MLAALLFALVVSCGDNDGPTGISGGDPQGTIWLLTDWEGDLDLENISDLDVALEFVEGGIAGYSGCNWFGAAGTYNLTGHISVTSIGATLRGCECDRHGTIEEHFYDALQAARQFGRSGHQLFITFDDGNETGTMIFAAVNETEHYPVSPRIRK